MPMHICTACREDPSISSSTLDNVTMVTVDYSSSYFLFLLQVFQRLMKPFLLEYKNPCFLQVVGKTTERKCLPYFIEIGAAKCGSTDLYFHLTRHPQIVQLYKEPHFWTHIPKTGM